MSRTSRSFEACEKRKCRAKKKFNTVKDAAICIASAAINCKMLFQSYECRWCGKIHLTSRGINLETDQLVETFA